MYTVYVTNRKTGSTTRKYTRVQDAELAGEHTIILYLSSINNTTARIDTRKYDVQLCLNRYPKHTFIDMTAFLYKVNHTNDEDFIGLCLNATILAVEEFRANQYRAGIGGGVEWDELATTLTSVEDEWHSTPSPRDIDRTDIVVRALINMVANELPGYMRTSLETNARVTVGA